MEIRRILAAVDHTLLAQGATWEAVRTLCDEGLAWGVASLCIPGSHVARAKAYVGDRLAVGTVIGFPNGYATTAAKRFEAEDAVRNGADELDRVLNIGWVKEGRDEAVLEEIRQVRAACPGRVLKVIIETCLLTEAEKVRMCRVVSDSGADFIKTSTGFAGGGATRADVALLRAHTDPRVKVKAAGGISTLEDAWDFLELGAARLGSSRLVGLARAALEAAE